MSRVHLFDDDGDVEVWLDTEINDRDGLCIGTGRTRAEAIASAQAELKEAERVLDAAEADNGAAIAREKKKARRRPNKGWSSGQA